MKDYAVHTDMEDESGNKIIKYVVADDVEIENAGENEDTVMLFYRFKDDKGFTVAYYPEQLVQWIDSTDITPTHPETAHAEEQSAVHSATR